MLARLWSRLMGRKPGRAGRPGDGTRLHAEELESRGLLSADSMAFVARAAQHLIGQRADPGRLTAWGAQLDGGVPRRQVVLTIEATPEAETKAVHDLTISLFATSPTFQTLAGGVALLQGGGTLEQVELRLL